MLTIYVNLLAGADWPWMLALRAERFAAVRRGSGSAVALLGAGRI